MNPDPQTVLANAVDALTDEGLTMWLHVFAGSRDELQKQGDGQGAGLHAALAALIAAEEHRRRQETRRLEKGFRDTPSAWWGRPIPDE